MKFKLIFLALICIQFQSCRQQADNHLTKIQGERIEINDSLKTATAIEDFVKPYRDHVNKNLDSVIAYSVKTYTKNDGELETEIGNLMADMVYEQANLIFNKRTGKDIDMVLLNHGGIRSIISKGPITTRTAYKVMPFENETVVVDLKGTQIKELIKHLASAKRAHPFSGLRLQLDKNDAVIRASINGKSIDYSKNYLVATSDYLYNGGDRMSFFQTNDSLYTLDYKIRNALIDYFKKVDTLNPQIDGRFTKLNN